MALPVRAAYQLLQQALPDGAAGIGRPWHHGQLRRPDSWGPYQGKLGQCYLFPPSRSRTCAARFSAGTFARHGVACALRSWQLLLLECGHRALQRYFHNSPLSRLPRIALGQAA